MTPEERVVAKQLVSEARLRQAAEAEQAEYALQVENETAGMPCRCGCGEIVPLTAAGRMYATPSCRWRGARPGLPGGHERRARWDREQKRLKRQSLTRRFGVAERDVRFTDRQREVVFLLARGYSSDEIADELGITARTVKTHSDALRWKLGVEKRRQVPEAFMRVTGVNPFPVPVAA